MNAEEWTDIRGYEGLYKISNLGRVKGKKDRILQRGPAGYWIVDLYKKNIRKTCLVHRLLAEAFITNIGNKPNINHKNGVRDDNRLENLEWCTQQENVKHAFDTLGRKNNFQTNHPKTDFGHFGKDHHCSKPVIQLEHGIVLKLWDSAMDAVRSGFRSSKISECCSGKRKSHAGYQWQYASS